MSASCLHLCTAPVPHPCIGSLMRQSQSKSPNSISQAQGRCHQKSAGNVKDAVEGMRHTAGMADGAGQCSEEGWEVKQRKKGRKGRIQSDRQEGGDKQRLKKHGGVGDVGKANEGGMMGWMMKRWERRDVGLYPCPSSIYRQTESLRVVGLPVKLGAQHHLAGYTRRRRRRR